uniref:DDE_Tnp_ISL3 domain-containing protein n=1 Tax=Panagrellus redivivus TaxID=6233 RepID=A0A7E4W3Y9_PANRE
MNHGKEQCMRALNSPLSDKATSAREDLNGLWCDVSQSKRSFIERFLHGADSRLIESLRELIASPSARIN